MRKHLSQNTSFSTDLGYEHVGINKQVTIYTGESDLMKMITRGTIPYVL